MENSSLEEVGIKNFASFLLMKMCLAIISILEEGCNMLLISAGSTELGLLLEHGHEVDCAIC